LVASSGELIYRRRTMRTLACLGTLALFLAARGALAAPGGGGTGGAKASDTADDAPDTAKSDTAAGTQKPDDASPTRDKGGEAGGDKKEDEPPSYGHGRQFGLRAGVYGGYNMVFRYDRSPFCSVPKPNKATKDQQKFCGHQAPFGADLALAFAPLDSIELFLWGRFGFTREKETDTNPLVVVGAGARAYTMSDSAFKVFIEPAIGLELEGGGTKENWQATNANYNPEYKQDVIFHVAAGPQYDFAKSVGIYLDAGLTVGILRSIHTTMELNAGVQARLP